MYCLWKRLQQVWCAVFTFFFAARPLLLANLLLLSIEAARRRGDLPLLPPSGLSIHQELLPVPSFCTRINLLCRDRLCLIEFCGREREQREHFLSVMLIVCLVPVECKSSQQLFSIKAFFSLHLHFHPLTISFTYMHNFLTFKEDLRIVFLDHWPFF